MRPDLVPSLPPLQEIYLRRDERYDSSLLHHPIREYFLSSPVPALPSPNPLRVPEYCERQGIQPLRVRWNQFREHVLVCLVPVPALLHWGDDCVLLARGTAYFLFLRRVTLRKMSTQGCFYFKKFYLRLMLLQLCPLSPRELPSLQRPLPLRFCTVAYCLSRTWTKRALLFGVR